MSLTVPPPLAWYGSSFAYVEPLTDEERDAVPVWAHAGRLAGFSPKRFEPRPGGVVLGRFLSVHDGHRYLIALHESFTGSALRLRRRRCQLEYRADVWQTGGCRCFPHRPRAAGRDARC